MPEISVIVPVYNVQEYVGECIESILRQSFTDFELILVDDGPMMRYVFTRIQPSKLRNNDFKCTRPRIDDFEFDDYYK